MDRLAAEGLRYNRFRSASRRDWRFGIDVGSAIDFTYKRPFTFTGTIEKVTVELK
jgi:hypothetical protein